MAQCTAIQVAEWIVMFHQHRVLCRSPLQSIHCPQHSEFFVEDLVDKTFFICGIVQKTLMPHRCWKLKETYRSQFKELAQQFGIQEVSCNVIPNKGLFVLISKQSKTDPIPDSLSYQPPLAIAFKEMTNVSNENVITILPAVSEAKSTQKETLGDEISSIGQRVNRLEVTNNESYCSSFETKSSAQEVDSTTCDQKFTKYVLPAGPASYRIKARCRDFLYMSKSCTAFKSELRKYLLKSGCKIVDDNFQEVLLFNPDKIIAALFEVISGPKTSEIETFFADCFARPSVRPEFRKCCFNCLKSDHYRRSCLLPPRPYRYCFNCGKRDVSLRNCPTCAVWFFSVNQYRVPPNETFDPAIALIHYFQWSELN
ncbi:uncharacterized protein [Venturia canescens]|nr:uncharacterized protein LOC122417047 isoform X2 [Venturia canescens]